MTNQTEVTEAVQDAHHSIEEPLDMGGRFDAKLVINDITTGTPHIIMTSARTGETFTFTVEEVNYIANGTRMADSRAQSLLDDARRTFAHPLTLPAGVILHNPNPDNHTHLPIKIHREEDTEEKDGTPILVWDSELSRSNSRGRNFRANYNAAPVSNKPSGWKLVLVGNMDTTIGFAEWNRPEAVTTLINQMNDQEALLIIAGMINPEQTSYLSARLVARELMEERAVKRGTLTPIRKMLNDNGLTTSDTLSRTERGLLRIMNIQFDNSSKKLPVACAIMCPRHGSSTLAERQTFENSLQNHGYDYQTMRTMRETKSKEWRDAWTTKARQHASEIPGWRIIDLPDPDKAWGNRENAIIWLTRVPENLWSSISRAVEREASKLNMNRGSNF